MNCVSITNWEFNAEKWENVPVTYKLELKECPFCGNNAIIEVNKDHGKADVFRIKCEICEIQQGHYHYKPTEAAEEWNEREYKDN